MTTKCLTWLAAPILLIALTLGLWHGTAAAQTPQTSGDTEQLVNDLDVALQRSTLSAERREKMRSAMRDLCTAHQNHQMIDGEKAASSLRSELNSGAFRPQDRQRVSQDIDLIRESRGLKSGG
jgi:hypothetical protein